MHNLLATRAGRLLAFFLLYVTEGIPVGFTATAVATQMRTLGVSPAAIGTFVATLYLPWSWKWAMGPVVDLIYSDRFGRRRGWILLAQIGMAATLLLAMPIDFTTRLGLFTWIILAHNVFAATQDVAIDALAVATLPTEERGVANGMMFAGSYIGAAVGGSGSLWLVSALNLENHFALATFPFVACAVLLVTLLVTLRLKEPGSVVRLVQRDGAAPSVGREIAGYLRTVGAAMFRTRGAAFGLAFALLPTGSYALSLALQSNLAVELGLSKEKIALLSAISAVPAAAGCLIGGWLSDRIGRRKAIALFMVATALPTLWLAWTMQTYGWVMPLDTTMPNRPTPSPTLVMTFWLAGLVFSLLHGLTYGSRSALFMDLADPRIGATHFTAYMAVLNLVIAYTAFWQGRSIERWGYPATLVLDALFGCVAIVLLPGCVKKPQPVLTANPGAFEVLPAVAERQVTSTAHGHVLTNANVFSPDSKWIAYDVRPDAEGSVFEGDRIEAVNVDTGEIRTLYQATNGGRCGVVTFSPVEPRVAFIAGPEQPTPDFTYGPARRRGVMARLDRPGVAEPLDARDLTPPFTPGALRGGSHVHVFSPDGTLVSFTYDDHVLATPPADGDPTPRDVPSRNIGVSILHHPVTTPKNHPRNHDGSAFTVLVTRTVATPAPGSDDYRRAYEEGWIGTNGYLRSDGSRQRRSLAFLGDVIGTDGKPLTEVFVADLPESFDTGEVRVGVGPLEGSAHRLPWPPAGVVVRRLTRTADRKHPGVQGVRHWVRSAPDGSVVACLMRDDAGVSQLWLVGVADGTLRQLTRNAHDIASAFTWTPDGRRIAHVMDGSVCLTDAATGQTVRLTERAANPADGPLPLACVVSPDGRSIAYLRRVPSGASVQNQIFVVAVP
jgi:MFS family permease